MNKELSSKERAIYQAVFELFVEGADLNNLTVAEITRKAGIGKGTAYEYFSDKEEMIAKAIIYNGELFCKHTYDEVRKEKNLHDKISLILCKVESQTTNINCMFRLMHMMSDNSLIGRRLQELRREWKRNRATDEMVAVYFVKQIILDEFQENDPPAKEEIDYLVMSVLSKILCYDMLLNEEGCQQAERKNRMHELICQGICREVEEYKR